MCHCYLRQDGLGAVVVTDKEYPAGVAFNLESKLLEEFDTKYMYMIVVVLRVVPVGRTRRKTTNSQLQHFQRHFKTIRILQSVTRSHKSIHRSMKQKRYL